jgi:hypothetical protein
MRDTHKYPHCHRNQQYIKSGGECWYYATPEYRRKIKELAKVYRSTCQRFCKFEAPRLIYDEKAGFLCRYIEEKTAKEFNLELNGVYEYQYYTGCVKYRTCLRVTPTGKISEVSFDRSSLKFVFLKRKILAEIDKVRRERI